MLDRTTPPSLNDEFWKGFRQYLKTKQNEKVANDTLRYSRQYYHILLGERLDEMLQLSPGVQRHVMKSIASLSKYMGCYDRWKSIKERYQLKWSQQDSLETFHEIMNSDTNYKSMIEWLRKVCSSVPESYANVFRYDALTGLRAGETILSIRFVQRDIQNYLKKDSMVLEHYRYKAEFIRRTKKAYISVVDDSILELGRKSGLHSYMSLRMFLEERGLEMRMGYCRKIFSTHLRMSGIESEIVDLLQGRIPNQVFVRHYFRPDFDKVMEKIRKSLDGLYDEIV